MIYIFSGDIRTGKTTALLNWSKNKSNVDGLLCPDGKNGKRFFLKIKSEETFKLEVEKEIDNDLVIEVGSFHFLKSAFKTANDFLLSFTSKSKNQYLIIDELGKLELKNQGLHIAAQKLIPKYMLNENQHLILVVRESLFDDILKHYAISEYKILKKEDFENFN